MCTVEQQLLPWTLDELLAGANAIFIGKVVELLPAEKLELPTRTIIYTDVIIEVERYLYSDQQARRVCVRVEEGRVGNMVMINAEEPAFVLGESCFLTLYRPPYECIPPDGFSSSEYFVVAGCKMGKYDLKGLDLVGFDGKKVQLKNVEEKVYTLRSAR